MKACALTRPIRRAALLLGAGFVLVNLPWMLHFHALLGTQRFLERGDREHLGRCDDPLTASTVDAYLEHGAGLPEVRMRHGTGRRYRGRRGDLLTWINANRLPPVGSGCAQLMPLRSKAPANLHVFSDTPA